MPWLQLIRWKNLLIILLTQFLAWWSVVRPEVPAVLSLFHFTLLALSTVLVAAAGYIINDYFDIKIDVMNKPDKVVLERIIPRKHAIIAHAALNIAALAMAAFIAMPAHHPEWLLLQLACIILLWFYSTDFKRQYLTGNIVVSLLTALTILSLVVYEPVIWRKAALPLQTAVSWDMRSALPLWQLVIYAYFAFMLTWMREIVKDMEDHIGDGAEGCVTLPVKRGLQYAARFVLALSALVFVPLVAAAIVLFRYGYPLLSGYTVILLVGPLIAWAFFLNRGFTPAHYHKCSRGLKIIMLLGVFSLLIYHLQLYGYVIEE
jgi:4-hydroxybenzoate polyprenyltransferase